MSSNFHTSSKPLKEVDIRPPENTVKGAVKLNPHIGKYIDADFGQGDDPSVLHAYVTFDKQNEVLSYLITRLVVELKLPRADQTLYALKFESRENDGAFLTEHNRALIRQGFLLILTAAPERYSYSILRTLSQGDNVRSSLSELLAVCGDVAFATQFHRAGGIAQLLRMVEDRACADDVAAQSLMLQALLLLMEHSSLLQWSDVTAVFVSRIADNITGKAKQEDNSLLLSSLNIIDQVLNSTREVREHLRPSIVELVRRNRKNVLKNGFTFGKLAKSKSIQKGEELWLRQLDGNEKTLLCTNCVVNEHAVVMDPSTTIKSSDRLSIQAQNQVDRFLNIELKMRLLQLDHLPNSCHVPPLPSNLDWIQRGKLQTRGTL